MSPAGTQVEISLRNATFFFTCVSMVPGEKTISRPVEERRVGSLLLALHPFAACDHPEVTQAAQLDHIPFFQPFLHDGRDAVR
ncbi:MAG: hypothetical protein ACLR6J_03890 [Parabacteroides merdae]